jgi:3-oxoacyl-[acyl-carrier protein] reductase
MNASEGMAERVAVVTGVSRQAGIGFAIARRLLGEGASVFCQSWTPHDAEQGWGVDPAGITGVVEALDAVEGRLGHASLDLGIADNSQILMSSAVELFGHVDVLVVNHARSSTQSLSSLTVEELDRSWQVNARASVLLVQAFAAQHDDDRPGGRVVLFTSGQHREPMSAELPYAISKGAVHQMTLSLADALADRGITVNGLNPGPTDTGWASPDQRALVAAAMPRGRWTTPDEVATVVGWLVSDGAATVTGQVIDAESGFRRWAT